MKSFIVSLIIILLMIVLVIVNATYINNICKKMLLELDNINDSISSFKEEWKRNMFFVSLSSSHREINKINEQITLLEEALENDNAIKVNEIRELIKLYIEEISNHERLHIDNII